ncbi:MAG TPA: hypothetical protein VHP81_02115 [Lachnospiraceae bacterium]|nr:hypothetical protein [Lachnospiraceae bacterium]
MGNRFFNKRNLGITVILLCTLFLLPSHTSTNDTPASNTPPKSTPLSESIDNQAPQPSSQSIQKDTGLSSQPINILTKSQLQHNQRILTNLRSFQHLTENYIHQLASTKTEPSATLLMASFIRTGRKRYTGSAWKALAGSEEAFYAFVRKAKGNECASFLRRVEFFYDPVTGEKIDFIHLFASLNVYLENEFTYRIYPQIGDIGGWAGDCIQLASEGKKGKIPGKDLKAFFRDRIGIEGSFGSGDILADVDAMNIFALLKSTEEIPATFEYYYNGLGQGTRYQLFIQNRFPEVTSQKMLKKEIGEVFTKRSYLMSLVLGSEEMDLNEDKRYLKEAGDCFATYVWEGRDGNAR